MAYKTLIILLSVLFCCITTMNIVADHDNPLQFKLPTNSQNGQAFIFRFSLPSGSIGLNYKQYIAVAFPQNIKSDLLFDYTNTAKYSCSLTDGTKNIVMSAAQYSDKLNTNPGERNIAYCRLDDVKNSILKINNNYILTLTLNVRISSTNFIQSIGLFTSTSNNPDKIIIDSLPMFGTVAQYNDWTSYYPKPIEIMKTRMTPSSDKNGGSLVYPYDTFDLTITIKANTYISIADTRLVFRYPNNLVSFPTSITSDKENSFEDTRLKGSLSINSFDANGILITGIEEDLTSNRQYEITLKGWKALDNISDNALLELYVYYMNTYSVYSYHSAKVFTITKSSLDMTVSHPEKWDIWRNGAWPIKFMLTPTTDLINGGYLVIQHSNTEDGVNKLSFIAATCDFSDNDALNQAFGKRPNCYPLRTDFNHTNKTNAPYKGSGIFLFINNLMKAKPFYLTVWIFADNCGGVKNNSAKFKFTSTFYRNIDATLQTEARFTGKKNQVLLAESIDITMIGECYNNAIQGSATTTKPLHFEDDFLSSITLQNNGNSGDDLYLFKEIHDWSIIQHSSPSSAEINSYAYDIKNSYTEAYIYSANKNISSNTSYFLIRANLNRSSEAKIVNILAMPLADMQGTPKFSTHRMILQFSKKWFVQGDPYSGSNASCYLSWAFNDSGNLVSQNRLVQQINGNTIPNNNSNFITSVGKSLTLDSSYTNLANPSATTYKIVSTIYSSDGNEKWGYADALKPSKGTNGWLTFGLFTSCLKWSNSFPDVKSLYTYIDIQIQFSFVQRGYIEYGSIRKNNRFIKLFPEGGVFQDPSQVASTIPNTTLIKNHVAWGISTENTGICLLEINGFELANQYDGNSNTLIIWIFYGSLLETDYSDVSVNYPVAPLANVNINAYGLQSAHPQTDENQYVSPQFTGITPIEYILQQIGNSNNSDKVRDNSSHYHFLMGSQVVITGINSTKITSSKDYNQTALLIPYYCPLGNNNSNNIYSNVKLPTAMIGYLSISPDNQNKVFNRFFSRKGPNNSSNYYVMYGDVKSMNPPTTAKDMNNINYVTLRFKPYTDPDNNILYVFNSTIKTQNLSKTCSGFSLFVQNTILFSIPENNALSGVNHNPDVSVSKTTKFYTFGKQFSNSILSGLGPSTSVVPNNIPGGSANAASSSIFYTGIKRPTIDSFISNNTLDKIGFFCTSNASNDYHYLTNYIREATINNYILDYNPNLDYQYDAKSVITDKEEIIYKNDIASNLKFNVNLPLSTYSIISFSSFYNSINGNTVCGIQSGSNSMASECINIDGVIKCTPDNSTTYYTICCHNIIITDTIKLNLLKVDFPLPGNSIGLDNYISTMIYDAQKQINYDNPFIWNTSNNNASEINITTPAKISSISYRHTNQDSGIGVALIQVALPREPTRNMKLVITGDFSYMQIPGSTASCAASFSPILTAAVNAINTDIFSIIGTCKLNFSSSQSEIVVMTKNLVYKCGLALSKNLYIIISPVLIINYKNTPFSNNKYTVMMKLNIPQGNNDIALNTTEQIITDDNFTGVSEKSKYGPQWDTLCPVTINPQIPGEYADYKFDIDISKNQNAFTGSNILPNEITIYFPTQYYGLRNENIYCYLDTILQDCTFSEDGFLNILLRSALPISSEMFSIIITGIINPTIDMNISFPCTINNIDLNTTERKSLLVGSGLLPDGINMRPTQMIGSLIYQNTKQMATDYNPRSKSSHTFRITFDTAVGLNNLPITIYNNPVLCITFPAEYHLPWYLNSKVSVTIDEYSEINNTVAKINTLHPLVSQLGNRVILKLTTSSYTFNSNWKFWDLKIYNVPNPSDNITTGLFSVLITNSNFSSVYRTYTNVNNYANLSAPLSTDQWLNYYRGISFQFDQKKWIIDIINSVSPNSFIIKPGRFTPIIFRIRDSIITLPAAYTIITITDPIFRTLDDSYLLSSSNDPVDMYIGVPCDTVTGTYVVKINSSDITNFVPLPHIQIMIVNPSINPGIISYEAPTTIPPGSMAWLNIKLNEINVDPIDILWLPTDGNTNDQTTTVTKVNISRGNTNPIRSIIQNTNINGSGVQSFKITNSNRCYKPMENNVLTFKLEGVYPTIPSFVNGASYFKYMNSNNDIPKNSIKISYIPAYNPIFIYCALTCLTQPELSEDEIKNPKLPPTPLSKYYNAYISTTTTNTPQDIIFNDLIRGQNYKLSCVLESTQNDLNTHKSAVVNIQKSDLNEYISPPVKQPTSCMHFYFDKNPNILTKIAIINYCQKIYSKLGFINNGCVTCTDYDLIYNAPGIRLPDNKCDISQETRLLQTSSANSIQDQLNRLSICAIPSTQCPSDMKTDALYNDSLNQIKNDLATTDKLKANLNMNISENLKNVFITDDNIKPETSSIIVENIKYDKIGVVSWTSKSSAPMICYWQLSQLLIYQVNGNDVIKCTSNMCGKINLSSISTNVTTDPTNQTAIAVGNYNIFYVCYNDVPNPIKQSNLVIVSSFTNIKSSTVNRERTSTDKEVIPESNNVKMIDVRNIWLFLLASFILLI